jgi:hypothetical protein
MLAAALFWVLAFAAPIVALLGAMTLGELARTSELLLGSMSKDNCVKAMIIAAANQAHRGLNRGELHSPAAAIHPALYAEGTHV